MIADAAHAHNIWVGVCGEMAGEIFAHPAPARPRDGRTERGRVARAAGEKRGPKPNDGGMRSNWSSEVLELDTPAADPRALHAKWRNETIPNCSARRRRRIGREMGRAVYSSSPDSASDSGSISGLSPSSSILRRTSLMSSTSSHTSWLT